MTDVKVTREHRGIAWLSLYGAARNKWGDAWIDTGGDDPDWGCPSALPRIATAIAEAEARCAAAALTYLQDRIASHRRGVSMRDARDLAVDDVLRKYATPESPADPDPDLTLANAPTSEPTT